LNPLEDMTETAGAFAKGDLSRRVRFSDERTEVGRLGRALNGMLVQIESAFGLREQSEERLRRFVADASHDLRTPLTSIRGYAELLRKGAFSEESERRRALGRIEHEAERMAVLVDDLLLLARLDQGRPVAHDPVEVRPLVADAVAAARAVDTGRAISLDCPYGVLVQGDAGRIRQAVDNLLRNAVVHTPAESSVEVRVETTDSAVRLSVADDGPGLTPEEAEHVFDRFFQADLSRTGRGTGLGLSIVAAIADAHGGRTWVESTPGVGSIFYFELPIDPHESAASSDLGPDEETEQAAPRGGEHVWYGVTR
jgi:two-component system OmpR family sensor kinase